MPQFIVSVREVHIQGVKLEAKNREEAIRRVRLGEGLYLDNCLEYSHTLDPESWTVEEVPPG